jgi:uncharacterized protein (TIGR00725 family)
VTGRYVAVCGPGAAAEQETRWAEEIGRRLADAGAVVVCGGLGGVMDAAARGATTAGGIAVGLLPGESRSGASPHLTVALPLGIGEARNAFVVKVADAVIAVGGEWGTLSEIALAAKMGIPVILLGAWEHLSAAPSRDRITRAETAEEAVSAALEAAAGATSRQRRGGR